MLWCCIDLRLEPPPIGASLRFATGSAPPTVAGPGFSDQPAHDDYHLGESDPEIDDPLPTLRTPHHFLWALCQELVRSTTQRFVVASEAGLPFSEIMASKPRSFSFSLVARES